MDADLLEQFVETTGSTMAEAMKYLKLCDNDINAAVGCYFDPTVVSRSHLINFPLTTERSYYLRNIRLSALILCWADCHDRSPSVQL